MNIRRELRRHVGRLREAWAVPWAKVAARVRERAALSAVHPEADDHPGARMEVDRPGARARDESARVRWVEEVEAARREWLGYRAYFDCVSEPELVDHAIYAVQAAERKYMYLLRRARMAGVDLTEPVGADGPAEPEAPWLATSVPSGTAGAPRPRG